MCLHILALGGIALALARPALAEGEMDKGPGAALNSALVAACEGNQKEFARYLAADNAAAYLALPAEQRKAMLERLSLLDKPGRPLLSTDLKGDAILRCEASDATTEFYFGPVRTHENLAFIPVAVVGGETTQFGMVREGSGWKLLSLGLLLIDIPQLSKQWAKEELEGHEREAIVILRQLAEAIKTYRDAFGKLPESLAQLGPPANDGVSPHAANLVDADLAADSKGGYQFRYRIVPAVKGTQTGFELAAIPEEYGKTGRRSFFLDSEGELHGADKHGALATIDDPLLPAGKDR